MSYQRLSNDVDMDGIRQLVHHKLMKAIEDEPGALKLTGSSLCTSVPLFGERYKRNDLYDLRISKSVVKGFVEKALTGYNSRNCATIALLYRTGFGLPQSRECYLLWEVLASGNAPKVNDRVFHYRDMVRVLKEHWRQVNKANIDPDWLYFDSQNKYYGSLLERTYSTLVEAPFIQRRQPAFTFAKYEGIDCTLVYRVNSIDGSAKLYSAYSRIRGKQLNCTVQMLKAKNIPNTLPEGSVPGGFGPYFIVSGTVTIKRSDQRHLCKEWGQASCLELIKQSFNQDIYALAEFKSVKLARSHPSVDFCKRYRSKYSEARRFIRKNRGTNLSKRQAVLFNKAQSLVDVYEDHQAVIDKADAEYKRLREFEIFDRLQFVVYDAYGFADDKLKFVSTPFERVYEFIGSLGFVVTPILATKSKNVKRIHEQALQNALRGYCVDGIVARLNENGDVKDDSLNWVKLKL